MVWEVDWDKSRHKGISIQYWARNMKSAQRSAQEWHWTYYNTLKDGGVPMPVRDRIWEIDWSNRLRRGHKSFVWARNPNSTNPASRDWHWTGSSTLSRAGIPWIPVNVPSGRQKDANGYIRLTRLGMTPEQIQLCDDLNLWLSNGRSVAEHRLIAAECHGYKVIGRIVRHMNGIKDDNRPENLKIGTYEENKMDHATAVIEMAYWRQRFAAASVMLMEMDIVVPDSFWLPQSDAE